VGRALRRRAGGYLRPAGSGDGERGGRYRAQGAYAQQSRAGHPRSGPEGLPEAERLAKLAELERDIEGLQRQEEALIVAILAEFGPTVISRRRDARSDILLGVRIAAPQAVAKAAAA
jgi:hypothetical protein